MAKKRKMVNKTMPMNAQCWCAHVKKKAAWMLVIGVLLALNAWYMWTDAWFLVGVLIAIGALAKLAMPNCRC